MSDGTQLLVTAVTGGLAGALAGIGWEILREWRSNKERKNRIKDGLLKELSYCWWLINHNRDATVRSYVPLPLTTIRRVTFEPDTAPTVGNEIREKLKEVIQETTKLNAAINAVIIAISAGQKPPQTEVNTIKNITSDSTGELKALIEEAIEVVGSS